MPTFKISEDIRHELNKFKLYMQSQEYAVTSVTGYATYLSRFMRQTGVPLEQALPKAIKVFLEAERVKSPKTFKDCRAALKLYYRMTTGDNLKHASRIACISEISDILQRFKEYSLEIKQLEVGTVVSEISHVRNFLEHVFAQNPQSFINGIKAEDIRKYVVERLSSLSNSSKGRYITSIRNFFRCQEFFCQPVHPSIFRLPLSPAIWKKSAFPTTIEIDIFDELHKIPDENTEVGKRNRCIILCFTELALRCSEVAALTLDDFNWRSGYLIVRKTKNGAERILPLSALLGNALVEYLVHVRPLTSCRTLFVRFSHQHGEPMGCGQVRGVIRRNSSKAGLEDNACGTHILRRTAATRLYNSGNSLKMTADILGHESLDSTVYYAKTDIAGLLSVASPWPRGGYDVE